MPLAVADLRALFARSGNRCAFPSCKEPLVQDDNLFIGQVCHIAGASPDGPRYDPNQTEEQRHGYDNLLLLCYPHHRRIDADTSTCTVLWLTETKGAHEALFTDRLFSVRQDFLDSVLAETEEYWRKLALLQKLSALVHESPMHIDPKSSNSQVFAALRIAHRDIGTLVSRLAPEGPPNPPGPTPWEAANIYLPNLLRLAAMQVCQLEVQYLSLHAQSFPGDTDALARLQEAQVNLVYLTKVSGYVD